MAQQAEEYGSHDKTFEIPVDGTVRVVNRAGDVVMQHEVEAGDVWRACQVKDAPVRDWVRPRGPRGPASPARPSCSGSTRRARTTRSSSPRCGSTCPSTTRRGSTIEIMAPADACRVLARADPPRRGHHLGHRQRAARLPHRPLPDPGARHQRQDALDRAAHERRRPVRDRRRRLGAEARAAVREGEPPALGLARRVPRAGRVARVPRRRPPTTRPRSCSPTRSTGPPARCSNESRSPSRKVHELDNRGSHFYLALYWAQELAAQTDDAELAARVRARSPRRSPPTRSRSSRELNEVQGSPVDIGGYYFPDDELVTAAMRPSADLQRHHRRHLEFASARRPAPNDPGGGPRTCCSPS